MTTKITIKNTNNSTQSGSKQYTKFFFVFLISIVFLTTAWAQNPGSGTALDFNAAAATNVKILDNNDLDITDNLTLQMWMKFQLVGGYGRVLLTKRNRAVAGSETSYAIDNIYNGGAVRFYTYDGTWNVYQSTIPVPENEWTHIAVTYSGGTIKIYMNGVLLPGSVTAGSFSGLPASVRDLFIGGDENGNYHTGSIDEVSIWNAVLTEAEIRAWMCKKITASHPKYANLVSYYRFDEGTGTTLTDHAGNNDGILNNNPTWITSGAAIGDESTADYGNGNATTITQAHADGSNLTISNFTGTPVGGHVYVVNEAPNTTMNTLSGNLESTRYYGTFIVGGTSPTYKTTYNYTNNTNIDGAINEGAARLSHRSDNAGTTWSLVSGMMSHSPSLNRITICQETGKKEYSAGFDNGALSSVLSDKRGKMYDLSGTDEFVEIGNLGAVNDWTLETWFKPSGLNNYENIFHTDFPASGNSSQGVRLEMSSNYGWGHLYVGVSATNSWSPTTIVPLGGALAVNEWHHIAIAGDKTNSRLYVYLNGVKVVDRAYGNWPTSFSNLVMGKGFGPYAERDFNGSLDEFKVWNTVRTQNEIREGMHVPAKACEEGLVAYYQFDNDEAVGTVLGVKDVMGSFDGTTQNMTAANQVSSEVPVGAGFVDRITVTGAGLYNFPNTGLSMTFGATHPNGELVVTRIATERPDGWSSTGMDIDDEYFIVRNYGANSSFTALSDISFNNIGYIAPTDAATPNVFNLYKRQSNAHGATWGTAIGNATATTAGTAGSVSFDNTTNITSFSQFVIGTATANPSDLPVEMLYFKAERENTDEVALVWATETETNNQGFEIERMLEHETDFSIMGFVEGIGTTVHTTHYQYMDANSYPGISYYRLKQFDFDGTFTYSEVRAVAGEGNKNTTYIDVTVYPNPVYDELKVRFNELPESVNSASVQIMSMNGQILHEFSAGLQSYQVLEIEYVGALTPAMYLLAIELDNGEQILQKFVKK